MIMKVDRIRIADSFMKRLRGYMFHKMPAVSEVLIIKPCNQIHTFNMRFDIDVLFLDDQNRVLEKHMAVKPGIILPKVENATGVAESKTGLFESVVEGELICFEAPN
jgi:hypothetical protein